MFVRVHPVIRVVLFGLCTSAIVAGCSSEKSSNPLSPTVAGPIAGVTITSPKPLEPANGQEITVGSTIDLVIENASTTGERPLYQQIELSLEQDFASRIHTADKVSLGPNGRTTYRVPSALTGGRAYFWRVRAADGANTGPFSAGAMFKVVVPVVIEMPIPVSPVGDAQITGQSTQLVVRNTAVSGPAGAVLVQFDVARDAGFGSIVTSQAVPRASGETTALQVNGLPLGARYYWRTIATDGTTNSGWSPTQTFRTADPPPTPPPTTPAPTTPPPTSPPPEEPAPTPGATRNISIEEALSIIRAVHDGGRYNLGSGSSREQRIEFFWTAAAVVVYGHSRYNPRGGDPGWCVKDAGGGRPPSDDVLVRCGSRDAWDLIGGAGANGYSFHTDYIGKLSGEQNVYPPPRSSLPR